MVTYPALVTYMLLSSVAGLLAGFVLMAAFCAGHPAIRTMWERYRMAKELRRDCKRILETVHRTVKDRGGE